jgi:hypothetical protein
MHNCFGMNVADALKIKADTKDRQFIYTFISITRNMIGVTLINQLERWKDIYMGQKEDNQ